MMRKFIFFFLLSLVSLLSHAESPQGVFIQGVDANGTGCPSGSFAATVSPDGQSFSILLDNYIAETNLNTPVSRQACEFQINFYVPKGWSFAVTSADYRGFAYAELGAIVTHQTLYSFDGSTPRKARKKLEDRLDHHSFNVFEIKGPYNDNYLIHQALELKSAAWAPCNAVESQTLSVSTVLTAKNHHHGTNVISQISLDSIDGSLQSQKYQISWRRCQPDKTEKSGEGNSINAPGKDKNKDGDRGQGQEKEKEMNKDRKESAENNHQKERGSKAENTELKNRNRANRYDG